MDKIIALVDDDHCTPQRCHKCSQYACWFNKTESDNEEQQPPHGEQP